MAGLYGKRGVCPGGWQVNHLDARPLDRLDLWWLLEEVGICSQDRFSAIRRKGSDPMDVTSALEAFLEDGRQLESVAKSDLIDRLNDRWSDVLVRSNPQLAVMISYSTAARTASGLISKAAATLLILPPSAFHIR